MAIYTTSYTSATRNIEIAVRTHMQNTWSGSLVQNSSTVRFVLPQAILFVDVYVRPPLAITAVYLAKSSKPVGLMFLGFGVGTTSIIVYIGDATYY